jgi:hypothetical protein
LSNFLGGEEGLKDSGLNAFVHTTARIPDRQNDKLPGIRAWVSGNIMFVQFDISRLDYDFASARHRISRIYGQIHQNLLDLAQIDAHISYRLGRAERNGNVLPNHSLQHIGQIMHDII